MKTLREKLDEASVLVNCFCIDLDDDFGTGQKTADALIGLLDAIVTHQEASTNALVSFGQSLAYISGLAYQSLQIAAKSEGQAQEEAKRIEELAKEFEAMLNRIN